MWARIKNKLLILIVAGVVLPGCSEVQFLISSTKRIQDRVSDNNGVYKVGNPYKIDGVWYYPAEDWSYDETGIASWYGPNFHGKFTANGETYDMNALTAAHRTLPLPSFVRVVNLENGRSVVLRINDRGPFARGRIIDVSRRGAQLLGFKQKGTARVRVQVLADRSQALKAELQGGSQIAREGSPIKVDKLPKASVKAESLPPPPGAKPSPTSPVALREVASRREAGPLVEEAGASPRNATVVETVPVSPTQIYIQAGAFTNHQNALRTKVSVGRLGNTQISHVLIDQKDFYRVRVGPLTSVEEADRMLQAVGDLGYPGARIIIANGGE